MTLETPVSIHQTETGPLSGPDTSQLIADCLRERGFNVRMEGTALVTEVPPEQEEVFNAAVDNCTLRYFPPQGSDLPSKRRPGGEVRAPTAGSGMHFQGRL